MESYRKEGYEPITLPDMTRSRRIKLFGEHHGEKGVYFPPASGRNANGEGIVLTNIKDKIYYENLRKKVLIELNRIKSKKKDKQDYDTLKELLQELKKMKESIRKDDKTISNSLDAMFVTDRSRAEQVIHGDAGWEVNLIAPGLNIDYKSVNEDGYALLGLRN